MKVNDLRKMLENLDEDEEIQVCPPPVEEMKEWDGFLEITHIFEYEGRLMINTVI